MGTKGLGAPAAVPLRFGGFLFGGGKQDRTADLLHAMQALSQLSYTPTIPCVFLCKPAIIQGFLFWWKVGGGWVLAWVRPLLLGLVRDPSTGSGRTGWMGAGRLLRPKLS